MLVETKLCDFVEAVAAKRPTPGGGSVAAVSCSLGAALGIMVARFSTGPEAQEAAGRLEELKAQFLPLVDKDAEAYDMVSSAFGLPKSTDEEKGRRKGVIQNALREAAQVPLKVMMLSVRTFEVLVEFASKSNRNLLSDLAGAAFMTWAGMETAARNVRINVAGLTDKAVREPLDQEDKRLSARGAELRQQLMKEIDRLGNEKK